MPAVTVRDILYNWNIEAQGIDVCDESTLELPLTPISFADAPKWFQFSGGFDQSCKIYTSEEVMHDLRGIQIARILGKPAVSDVCVVILKAQPELRINIASGPAKIFVGRYGHAFSATINTWRDPIVCIGDRVTSNGARIVVDNSSVIIGRDSMFSDEILVQSNDQHR